MILFELNACSSPDIWQSAAKKNGIKLESISGNDFFQSQEREKALCRLSSCAALEKTVLLFADHGMQEGMAPFLNALPETVTAVPVGSDAMLLSRGNTDPAHINAINAYLTYGGEENILGLMSYLRYYLFNCQKEPLPPQPKILPMDGIYKENQVYDSLEAFLATESVSYPIYVGMLSHRSSWLQQKLQPEYAIIDALHREGIGVIPVFSAGEKSSLLKSLDFDGIVKTFFSRNGKLFIQGLVNFQMHLIKGQNGMSIADTSVSYFQKLKIPIFHPIASYYVTEKLWQEQNNPLAQEMNMDYLTPEMAGMIEPQLVALQSEDRKNYVPQQDNINLFAKRVYKWMNLRIKPNSQKKIALMLHNSVCSGVEATLGKAFGMDAFESTVRVMKRLREEGYSVENIPENGAELRKILMEKKAFSDFRWTGVEDIVNCGGCIYRMPVQPEYEHYFAQLPKEMRSAMQKSWGDPPGEGMVLGNTLIITGLRFGNLTVMVQPKRGCYGAKCTGEVCRILHDPTCPPTHQYLATYRYLEQDWQADAVIHMGTDGSLEYLPGKASGLGIRDWTFQVLGSLPNFYPYHLGVPSEGTIAKRRAGSILVGYYPASSRGFDTEDQDLMDKLNAFQESENLENGQAEVLRQVLEEKLNGRPILKKLLCSATTFSEGVSLVRSSLLQAAEGRKLSDLHVLGENPSHEEAVSYLCEVLRGEEILKKLPEESDFSFEARLRDTVEQSLSGETNPFAEGLRQTYTRLMQTMQEMNRLVDLLCGSFQPPSESGMPDENGRKILPTGRNFYMMNEDKIPTPTAWQRGKILADQLLEAYLRDEGSYPHKIAMNMISLDISRTHGEQMCQFLWLLGVRPLWDHTGRVQNIEPISLKELGRPRIDVTLRISGVMRDTWPAAVELMDQAVLVVSKLEESTEDNFIRLNIQEMEKNCGQLGERAKTIRIFGDPPGTFGAGIDLALKASAWETDKDLARYFIQSSAFAYGKDLNGRKSIQEFVENARNIDLTTDVSSSRKMDTLNCGFGVQIHGGYKLLAETIGNRKIRQYQASSELGTTIRTTTLAQKMDEDVQGTLLNKVWQEHIKKQNYQGASEIMHRIQTAFDAQCTGHLLEDKTLDDLADAYINDEEMRSWLLSQNPYAAEEIGRRMLELQSRGKWEPDTNVLESLKENYLTIEGFMEGGISGNSEIQGGSVEIVKEDQVELWQEKLCEIDEYLASLIKKSKTKE